MSTTTKYAVVISTYSNEDIGTKIINVLLAEKLAACIQVFPIKSFYTWKGAVSRDNENLMLIKAKASDFDAIKDVIRKNHDYEIPEIVLVPIEGGFDGYLNWMSEVTR